ncbi:hypothetical protein L208DRAFT_1460259 [Tricholoma matsutake]|nr:hypothetical protein L208DRAFT_1460259 [Tricholoma matsutake 945]
MLWKHAKSHMFDLLNCFHGISAHSFTISETSHSAWAGSTVAMCHYSTKDQQCGFWLCFNEILQYMNDGLETKQYQLRNDDMTSSVGSSASQLMVQLPATGSLTMLPDENVTPKPRCSPRCKLCALPPFAYAKDADSEFNEAVRHSLLEFTSSERVPDALCPTIATAHQAETNTNMSMSRLPMYHDVFEVMETQTQDLVRHRALTRTSAAPLLPPCDTLQLPGLDDPTHKHAAALHPHQSHLPHPSTPVCHMMPVCSNFLTLMDLDSDTFSCLFNNMTIVNERYNVQSTTALMTRMVHESPFVSAYALVMVVKEQLGDLISEELLALTLGSDSKSQRLGFSDMTGSSSLQCKVVVSPPNA